MMDSATQGWTAKDLSKDVRDTQKDLEEQS